MKQYRPVNKNPPCKANIPPLYGNSEEFPENAILEKGIPEEFPSIPDLGNSRFGRRAIPHTDPILWTTTVVNVYREVLP